MNDASLRLLITFGLLALFVFLEYIVPARRGVLGPGRMANQAGMALISAIVAKVALGGGLASIALFADAKGFGIFNLVTTPHWIAIVVSFLVLDFAIWVQHLCLHRLPFLWRLHRVHHGDTAMDVSTALRFHPFEIFASLAYKALLIMLLGAPAPAVFMFEIVLGAGALFTHANLALPAWLERVLRLVFVTPSLHLIHHSPNPSETNSNFGFSFNVWDRMFGTFKAQRHHDDGRIGLETWREPTDQTIGAMLINPFQ